MRLEQGDGNRIMNPALNALLLECLLQGVALGRPDRVHMPPVARGLDLARNYDPTAGKQTRILGRMGPAQIRPPGQVWQFDSKYGALDPFHPVVVPAQDVVIALFRAPVAEHPDRVREVGITGRDRAALAVSAEVFAGIEAEAPHVADA